MYRNLYLGIQRGLLHHVEKVCRKKVLNIVIALQKKKSHFCPELIFLSLLPLEWIYWLVHMM